jgi:tetratricopeptide (TPR) repeat protein
MDRAVRAAGRVLLLALAACAPSQAEDVPLPSLAGVETEVIEAITAARAALLREPESGKAWGRLGDHYFAHDFLAPAAACYARAEELDPGSLLWPYRLGLSLLKDHPEEAAAPLERSLRSLPRYAPAHEVYASVLVRLGRSDEAIENYERASELDPGRPEAEAGLGAIFLARGRYEAARAHLEAALARDERYVAAHIALAQVHLALGAEEKAARHAELSRALPQPTREWDALATPNLPPAGARARTRHGKALERQRKPEEAAEQYRAALRSNPEYYLARSSLADILVQQGRREEAIELLREAERANPSFEAVRKDLARLLGTKERAGPAGDAGD